MSSCPRSDIYVEAGMAPENTQQCYFRIIDDALRGFGYRLFRAYEQTHEWPTDSPLLRRVNLAYFSAKFADRNPYKLASMLYERGKVIEELEKERKALKLQVESAAAEAKRSAALLDTTRANVAKLETEALDLRSRSSHAVQKLKRKSKRLLETEERSQSLVWDRDDPVQRLGLLLEEGRLQSERMSDERRRGAQLQLELTDLARRAATLQDELEQAQLAQASAEETLTKLRADNEHLRSLAEKALAERSKLAEALSRASTERNGLLSVIEDQKRAIEDATRAQSRLAERANREKARLSAQVKELQGKTQLLQPDSHEDEVATRHMIEAIAEHLRSARRDRVSAQRAAERESRVRGHLSYRIGSAIVSNLASPLGVARVPVAVARACTEYHRTKTRNASQQMESSPVEQLAESGDRVLFVPGPQPVVVQISPMDFHREIWVQTLTQAPGKTTLVGVTVRGLPAAIQSLTLFDKDTTGRSRVPGEITRSFDLKGGTAQLLLDVPENCGEVSLELHKIKGVLNILCLEVRPPRGDSCRAASAKAPRAVSVPAAGGPVPPLNAPRLRSLGRGPRRSKRRPRPPWLLQANGKPSAAWPQPTMRCGAPTALPSCTRPTATSTARRPRRPPPHPGERNGSCRNVSMVRPSSAAGLIVQLPRPGRLRRCPCPEFPRQQGAPSIEQSGQAPCDYSAQTR